MAGDNPIAALFGRSPVKPMQEHITKAHECVQLLKGFFQASAASDWDKAEEVYNNIATLERTADKMKRDIRVHMPNSLFMPVARTDLLELLAVQDKLADRAKDIAGIMLGRKMTLPAEIQEDLLKYLDAAIHTSSQAVVVLSELDEAYETNFGRRENLYVAELCAKLDDYEHTTDKLQIEVRRALHSVEANYAPIDIIFDYQIIKYIGRLADTAQHIGNRVQILLAR